jgi:hypothetical protein
VYFDVGHTEFRSVLGRIGKGVRKNQLFYSIPGGCFFGCVVVTQKVSIACLNLDCFVSVDYLVLIKYFNIHYILSTRLPALWSSFCF